MRLRYVECPRESNEQSLGNIGKPSHVVVRTSKTIWASWAFWAFWLYQRISFVSIHIELYVLHSVDLIGWVYIYVKYPYIYIYWSATAKSIQNSICLVESWLSTFEGHQVPKIFEQVSVLLHFKHLRRTFIRGKFWFYCLNFVTLRRDSKNSICLVDTETKLRKIYFNQWTGRFHFLLFIKRLHGV